MMLYCYFYNMIVNLQYKYTQTVYILTSPYRRKFGSQSAHYQGTIRELSGRGRLRSAPFVLYRLTFFSYSSHIGLQSGHCLLTSGSLSCCCRVTIGSLVKTYFYTRLEPILQQIFTYFCRLTVGSSIGCGVNEALL